ncbi:hypothetical protein BN946_scf184965.g10 [Trametes cinnabarina]|uniref:Uncharacterized protein n=1 Tax=Pycnoporus cinnabarinus TaxID=5643 RepID=A0A060SRD1_PYCCI|nr:hypothetical protein BN946_scf184965.g10 [Trametes cinnabarina]
MTAQNVRRVASSDNSPHRLTHRSPPSSALGRGLGDGSIKQWDSISGQVSRARPPHTLGLVSLSVDPTGKHALYNTLEGLTCLWDLEDGEIKGSFESYARTGGEPTEPSWSVSLNPKGGTYASTGGSSNVTIHSAEPGSFGERRATLTSGRSKFGLYCKHSPDGSRVAMSSEAGQIYIFDLASNSLQTTYSSHAMAVRSLAWSADSSLLLSASEDKRLILHDVRVSPSGKPGSGAVATLTGHSSWVLSTDISLDGRLAVSGSADRTMKVWDIGARAAVSTVQDNGEVWSVSWRPKPPAHGTAGEAQNAGHRLKEILSITSGDLDEDLSIALTSLVKTAAHDAAPKHDLRTIVDAVKDSGCASELEPLTILPIVVGSPRDGAGEMVDLLAHECSAKEVVMAIEEAVEVLERHLHSEGEEDHGDHGSQAPPATQLVRLIRAYAETIPRWPRWKKDPKDAVKSRFAELESVISHVSREGSVQEGRAMVSAVSQLVLALSHGANQDTKPLLFHLVISAVGAFPNHFKAGLARSAFIRHFSRLVVPHSQSSSAPEDSEDVLNGVWSALRSIGLEAKACESTPSIATFILLAHDPSYTFSIANLTAFYPTVLSALQANIALDEILAVLINTLAPLHKSTPRPDLEVDLAIPLVHILPHIASNHPDPDIRHYTFRTLSLVLGLCPPPVRFGLLKELLADAEMPHQMRIAAVGLLKEAVLEGLSGETQNMFASPYLLSTFGPIILRPDPPDMFDTAKPDEFLDGPEPLRLVECLGFYYVLLQRDQQNRTGVRDASSLRNIQRSLLAPLATHLSSWKTGLTSSSSQLQKNDRLLQLDILEMWTSRIYDAVDALGSTGRSQ